MVSCVGAGQRMPSSQHRHLNTNQAPERQPWQNQQMSPDMMDLSGMEDLPHLWSENDASIPESVETPRFPSQLSLDFSDIPTSERVAIGGPNCPFSQVLQAATTTSGVPSPFEWNPTQRSNLQSQPSWAPDLPLDLWAGPSISQAMPFPGPQGPRLQQASGQYDHFSEDVPTTMQMPEQPNQSFFFPEWTPPSTVFAPPTAFGHSQSWSPNDNLAHAGGYGRPNLRSFPSWLPPIEGNCFQDPSGEPLARRGFSLGELPSLNFSSIEDGEGLQRPRSQGYVPPRAANEEAPDTELAGERDSGPFAFQTSCLSLDPSRKEAPTPPFKNKESTGSQVDETGGHTSPHHQLRPRLEAKRPVNNNASVHLLDAKGTELGSDDSGNMQQNASPRKSVKRNAGGTQRNAGGTQRMTYRVRSNALADLQMPNLKSRATSESGVKEAAADAQRVLKSTESERTASLGKQTTERGTKLSTSDSSLSNPGHSDLELLGQQAGDEGTVKLDPSKLALFCKQLQHIQKKVVRLQSERLASSKREEAVQMAGRSMQQAVQDLASMKAKGSSIDEREARMAEGASQLQQLLSLLAPPHGTTVAGPAPPPETNLQPEPEGEKAEAVGGDADMEDA